MDALPPANQDPEKRKGLKVFGTSALQLKVCAIGRKPSGERRINVAKPEGSRPSAVKNNRK